MTFDDINESQKNSFERKTRDDTQKENKNVQNREKKICILKLQYRREKQNRN